MKIKEIYLYLFVQSPTSGFVPITCEYIGTEAYMSCVAVMAFLAENPKNWQ